MKMDFEDIRGVLGEVSFGRNELNGFIQIFFDFSGTMLLLIAIMLNELWAPPIDMFQGNEEDTAIMEQEIRSFTNGLVWKSVVPGIVFGVMIANLFFAGQSAVVSYRTKKSATAMPYGINTASAFTFIFAILTPSLHQNRVGCIGIDDPYEFAACYSNAIEQSWADGVTCNFLAGLISFGLSLFASVWAKYLPMGVLLSALTTVCVSFLALNQLLNSFRDPVSGFIPLFLIFIGYFAEVPFGKIPTSLVVALVGTILGWLNQAVSVQDVQDAVQYVKFSGVQPGFSALSNWGSVPNFIGIVIPLSIQQTSVALMNVRSAATVGDIYPLRPAMLVDASCTMVTACFGSWIQTGVYVGHPAYKMMGAKNGYCIINAFVLLIVSLFGIFSLVAAIVPVTAIGPVIVFVGVAIAAQGIHALEKHQVGPVFVMAIIPGMCDLMIQKGASFEIMRTGFFGLVALGRSSIFFATLLSGILYFSMDRNFRVAMVWCLASAVASAVGLIHQTKVSIQNFALPVGEYCVTKAQLGVPESSECPDDYTTCGSDEMKCGYVYTTRWRFMVAYLLLALMYLILTILQTHYQLVPPQIETIAKPEDRSTKPTFQEQVEVEDEQGEQEIAAEETRSTLQHETSIKIT